MDAQTVVAIGTATTILVQMVKWAGLSDRWGPVAVLLISALGVALWSWSQAIAPDRTWAWPLFAAWISVAASAAGAFGFLRAAAPEHVTATKRPPPGVAQDPVEKL